MYRFLLKYNLLLLTIFPLLLQSISMDDINPAPPVTFIICEGPEMSGRKLARVTAKGYGNLLSYAEADENATIQERLYDSKTVGRQRYHIECRRDLLNKYARITVQLTRAAVAEKKSAHTKRRRICTEFSSTTGSSSTSSRSVQLLYKNVCILCNETTHLFRNNPKLQER